jgi:hypothetical protein
VATPRKDDEETRARAVRMYQERIRDLGESKLTARRAVGAVPDINPATLRGTARSARRAAPPARRPRAPPPPPGPRRGPHRQRKDTGLANLPLHELNRNEIWCAIVALASELTAWAQLLALHQHPARRWEPKRPRLRLFFIAAPMLRPCIQRTGRVLFLSEALMLPPTRKRVRSWPSWIF